eukprot:scaffold57437_cov33-Tisochrysis_lutea.AAC.5
MAATTVNPATPCHIYPPSMCGTFATASPCTHRCSCPHPCGSFVSESSHVSRVWETAGLCFCCPVRLV